MKRFIIILTALILLTCSCSNSIDLIIGTYGDHIYCYSFDSGSHTFTFKGKAKAANASYAIARSREDGINDIYAVSETGKGSGAISFRYKDGDMTMTADKRQTGADPCFLMLYGETDPCVITADYSGGSISVFPTESGILQDRSQKTDFIGSGPVRSRQQSPHIHQIRLLPGGGWILAADLGSDRIRVLKTDGNRTLIHTGDISCPEGTGPRHMEFSNDGSRLYCIGELSGEVLTYSIRYGDIPEFTLVSRVMADEVDAGGSADIHIHPSGKYLYTSHRLDNDGISVFSIDEEGIPEKKAYTMTARHPRNFFITPDGKHLLAACRDDKVIQVFDINEDGTLSIVPSVLEFEDDAPTSITLIR